MFTAVTFVEPKPRSNVPTKKQSKDKINCATSPQNTMHLLARPKKKIRAISIDLDPQELLRKTRYRKANIV